MVVQIAGVAGVQPSFGVDSLGGRLWVVEISGKDRRRAQLNLAAVAEPQLSAGQRLSDGVEVNRVIGVQDRDATDFGLAIDLFEVDPDGVEEAKNVRPQRGATCVATLDPGQS